MRGKKEEHRHEIRCDNLKRLSITMHGPTLRKNGCSVSIHQAACIVQARLHGDGWRTLGLGLVEHGDVEDVAANVWKCGCERVEVQEKCCKQWCHVHECARVRA